MMMLRLAFICLLVQAAPPQKLPAPKRLSPTARQIIDKRMQRHSRDLIPLVRSVVMLDYDRTAKLADSIVEDTMLARPLTGDASELNNQLPEKFFTLQDDLRTQARTLSDAAKRHDPEAMSDAFGKLSRTCVRCHSVYLQEP
jgi:cytochrome c556